MPIPSQPGRSRRRGLTLLECTLATTVLAFCAAGAATALSAAYQQQRAAATRHEATLLAEELAAAVVAQPYEAPAESSDDSGSSFSLLGLVLETVDSLVSPLLDGYSDTRTGSDGQTYDRRVTVAVDPELGGATVATIEVEAADGQVVRIRRLLTVEAP